MDKNKSFYFKSFLMILVLGILVLGLTACSKKVKECPKEVKKVCGANGKTYDNECLASKVDVKVASPGECPATNATATKKTDTTKTTGTTKTSGPTTSTTCSETDTGKDLFKASTTILGTISKKDKCMDSSTLLENYCEGGKVVSTSMTCPKGYRCSQGACSLTTSTTQTCHDTDGGEDMSVAGAVVFEGKDNPDECISESKIKEYYCDGDVMKIKEEDCPGNQVCSNGKCEKVPTGCDDSDNGKNTAEKGTTTLNLAGNNIDSREDICTAPNLLMEFYCDKTKMKEEEIDCGTGKKCEEGKCVASTTTPKISTCTDTDGGKDINKKGTTSNGTSTSTDKCAQFLLPGAIDFQVHEYFCENGEVKLAKLDCPKNYMCQFGKCVAKKIYTCKDSDGGLDYSKKGFTNESSALGDYVYYDECTKSGQLEEYYCYDVSTADVKTVSCQSGYKCKDGACVVANPCTETDSGKEYTKAGVTSKGTTHSNDYCQNPNDLVEYYCDSNGNMKQETYTCPKGCISSKCKT